MQAVVRYQLSHLVNLIPHKKDFYLSLYPEEKEFFFLSIA